MESNINLKPLIAAFNLIWGRYPEPAMLVHRSKKLVAVNRACRDFGRQAGTICAEHGDPSQHRDCLANEALAEGRAMSIKRELPGEVQMIVYWLPVEGYPDYYVHFSSGSLPETDSDEEEAL